MKHRTLLKNTIFLGALGFLLIPYFEYATYQDSSPIEIEIATFITALIVSLSVARFLPQKHHKPFEISGPLFLSAVVLPIVFFIIGMQNPADVCSPDSVCLGDIGGFFRDVETAVIMSIIFLASGGLMVLIKHHQKRS